MNHHITHDAQFPLSSENIRLLAELGFMAANGGQLDIALGIFRGLSVLRPSKVFSYVGLAVAYLNVGLIEKAITELIPASEIVDSEHEQIWIYLGLAYQRSGFLVKSRNILHHLLEIDALNEIDKKFVISILNNDSTNQFNLTAPLPALVIEQHFISENLV
jgi:tetratricopeptide (TPR) repeat protein